MKTEEKLSSPVKVRMKRERFSEQEARSKIGRMVRSLVDISTIPRGTRGTVVHIDEIEPGGFEVVVEWERAGWSTPDHDWFNKDAFLQCLTEE